MGGSETDGEGEGEAEGGGAGARAGKAGGPRVREGGKRESGEDGGGGPAQAVR